MGIYGIIRGMKKKAMKSILATALSIFAVAASCMASDASPDAEALDFFNNIQHQLYAA